MNRSKRKKRERPPRGSRKTRRDPGASRGRRGATGERGEPSDSLDPCVGWLRRNDSSSWIEPEPLGKALFVRDGSADSCDADEAVRFRISQPATHIHAAEATVVERLGPDDVDSTHLAMAVAGLGLPIDFSTDVESEAQTFAEVDADEALADGTRRDLRDHPHVTIDGEDARDFDDAVSARPEDGGYRVWVSIADVAWYVESGTALDREAAGRGTSVYLPTRVLPMLPETLSNGLCSLLPGQPRLTLTCEMHVDDDGGRSDVRVYPALIDSSARLTYTQVQSVIDGNPAAVPHHAQGPVLEAVAASRLLRRRRLANGSLDLDIAERHVVVGDDGDPANVFARRQTQAHHVIEDLMIAANESVAEYLLAHRLSGLFRVHPPPPREKWTQLEDWGKQWGFSLKRDKSNSPLPLARFAERLKQSRQAEAGQMLLLRSLSQAYYAAEVAGHFGLASEAYVHFTSPIRRYPDLLVHRALWHHWRGQPVLRGLSALADSSSETERRAVAAERDVGHLAACLVARRRLGEVMSAKVVGVHPAGLFVRPDEFFAEGLVPMISLTGGSGEYLEVREEAFAIVGRTSGIRFNLGDALNVRLVHVDIGRRRINYEIAAHSAEPSRARSATVKGRRKK